MINWIYGLIIAALTAIGLYNAGRSKERVETVQKEAEREVRVAEEKAEERVSTIQRVNDVVQRNSISGGSSSADRLRNEWSRD